MEGTIVLDGLIEGPIPDDASIEEKFDEWVVFAGESDLKFDVSLGGNAFSAMPSDAPSSASSLGPTPEDGVRQVLENLLRILPKDMQSRVFSTLRSSEYRKGEAVQAVYAVQPDGSVEVQTRVVDAKTVAPPEPIPVKEKIKSGLFGLVVVAAMLGISSFFIDYRAMWNNAVSRMAAPDPSAIEISVGPFGEYFGIAPDSVEVKKRTLYVTLKRTEAYPTSDEAFQTAYTAAAGDLDDRLAIEALRKGYVRVEALDEDGELIAAGELRIIPLQSAESARTPLMRVPEKTTVSKIVFRY